MKALIVYYSRTGTTKKVAEKLQKQLNADIQEIRDTVDRSRAIGYFKSGKDAMQKKLTTLKPTKKSPSDYDLIIIGTPVWAFTISTPVRTYIKEHEKEFQNVAFFCTTGGTGDKRTLSHMQELSKKPIATAAYTTKQVLSKNFEIKEFVKKIS